MRKTRIVSDKAKQQAYTLYLQGKSNREIAQQVKATEKTVAKWLHPYKQRLAKIAQQEKMLFDHIEDILKAPKFNAQELKTALSALEMLQKVYKTQIERL